MDKYTGYGSSGVAKYVKTPKIVEFKSLEDYLKIYDQLYAELKENGSKDFSIDRIIEIQNKTGYFDENLLWADFEKLREVQLTDFLNFMDSLQYKNSDESDGDSSMDQLEQIVTISALILNETSMADKKKLMNTLFKIIFMYSEQLCIALAPLCAFMGGVVAQEVVKAMT